MKPKKQPEGDARHATGPIKLVPMTEEQIQIHRALADVAEDAIGIGISHKEFIKWADDAYEIIRDGHG